MSYIKVDYLNQTIKLAVTSENIKNKMNECSQLLLGELKVEPVIKELTVKDGLIFYRMEIGDEPFDMYYEGDLSAHTLSMMLMDAL